MLPAAFPNLLANGANGIAVGMATSIPPHNAGELCAAALAQLQVFRERKLTLAEVAHGRCAGATRPRARRSSTPRSRRCWRSSPAPTSPPAACWSSRRRRSARPTAPAAAASACGRAGRRSTAKNGTWQIIVSEIPYQVAKAKLIEQIAALLEEKKLPLLGDIRDESTDVVRLVLEPKSRTVDPAVLMETLFRATDLETRLPLNMNALDADRTPRVMGLPEVLWCLAGPPPCGAGAPHRAPAGGDRPAAGDPRRLPDRLPQPR